MSNFDILIVRNSTDGNLVHGSIYLNRQLIGAAFENNDLKIATGTYRGLMRYNSGHNFVLSKHGSLNKKGDFLLEVSGVPGRQNILLHSGNKARHSKGCILLGPAGKDSAGNVFIDSNHPLYKLRLAFYGTDEPNSCPDKNVTITIQ